MKEKRKKPDIKTLLINWKGKAEDNIVKQLVMMQTLNMFINNNHKPKHFPDDRKFQRVFGSFERIESILDISKTTL